MPYITNDRRIRLARRASECSGAGELNFVITQICKEYIENHGQTYAKINDVIGALEAAKMEFYRRLVVPYEDEKIEQNGDVY